MLAQIVAVAGTAVRRWLGGGPVWWGLLTVLAGPAAHAQNAPALVQRLALLIDTTRYDSRQDIVLVDDEPRVYFYYTRDDQSAELVLTPTVPGRALRVRPSASFQLLDSLAPDQHGNYRATLRFRDLTATPFVWLTIEEARPATAPPPPDSAATPPHQTVCLLPLTRTTLSLRVSDPELFVGEEKVFDLVSSNPLNVKVSPDWTRGADLDYRLSRDNGQLHLHVLPNALGTRALVVRATAERPHLDARGKLSWQIAGFRQEFTVKASRLRFVAPDRKDVVLDEAGRTTGSELILSDGHAFELHRTYRLEAQQEPGGALVAELFTRNYLSNDRVLCVLRPFNPHRPADGYLYIKDGDQPRAVTNLHIAARPHVNVLSVLHRGGEWTTSPTVAPGETVDVRLEGDNLSRARFHVEGLAAVPSDSSTRSDQSVVYRVQIPLAVDRRRLAIFDGPTPTGLALQVKEAQRPHPLDFVLVNYGVGPLPATRLNGPILYGQNIKDVVLTFAASSIDDQRVLYGKQYLTLDVRVVDAKGNLVDQRTGEQLVICPGGTSPRAAFYQDKQCQVGPVSLNALLGRKTYDLGDWSRIQLTLRHAPGQYADPGYSQQIDLVLQRRTSFDIDVSFPAGLLTKRQGEQGYGDFSGISLATLAQLRFYKPGRINRLQPYKIGAGFVAINAFNLSPTASDRDLGLVILGSLSPIRPDAKLTFPLYLGGGYLLGRGKLFYLLGPGIGVRL